MLRMVNPWGATPCTPLVQFTKDGFRMFAYSTAYWLHLLRITVQRSGQIRMFLTLNADWFNCYVTTYMLIDRPCNAYS